MSKTLLDMQDLVTTNITARGIYQHFKGNKYLVIEVVQNACDSIPSRRIVIYQALYGDNLRFARPWEDFFAEVDVNRKDNVTGQRFRFVKVESGKY